MRSNLPDDVIRNFARVSTNKTLGPLIVLVGVKNLSLINRPNKINER